VIDFRYHIVSLISVFLALAVGIALGAGPLKETIGDTLTGQVQQLREEKDALRADLETTSRQLDDSTAYISAAAPQLLDGTLAGRGVAIVDLGEADPAVLEAVTARLADAGATVTAQVTVADAWTDPAQRSFRQALVGNLVEYLDPAPAEDAGVEVELAEALVQGLTGADPADPTKLADSSALVLELLASDEGALITVADPVEAPADAIVVLAPAVTDGNGTPSPQAASDEVVGAQVDIVVAAQGRSDGAVLADAGATRGAVTEAILGDGDLAKTLSTVSGVADVPGQVSVPLALNVSIGGSVGHYGFGDGETVLPEAVDLPPEVDTAVPPSPGDLGSGTSG
jgi:hypothetical protein